MPHNIILRLSFYCMCIFSHHNFFYIALYDFPLLYLMSISILNFTKLTAKTRSLKRQRNQRTSRRMGSCQAVVIIQMMMRGVKRKGEKIKIKKIAKRLLDMVCHRMTLCISAALSLLTLQPSVTELLPLS